MVWQRHLIQMRKIIKDDLVPCKWLSVSCTLPRHQHANAGVAQNLALLKQAVLQHGALQSFFHHFKRLGAQPICPFSDHTSNWCLFKRLLLLASWFSSSSSFPSQSSKTIFWSFTTFLLFKALDAQHSNWLFKKPMTGCRPKHQPPTHKPWCCRI